MDLRLQEWTWGCKDHLVSFKLFIILMYQGDIRHSIESNTFISLVGIVKFYFSRVRKLRILACQTCHRIMMNQNSHLFCILHSKRVPKSPIPTKTAQILLLVRAPEAEAGNVSLCWCIDRFLRRLWQFSDGETLGLIVETIHISCRQYIWFQSKIKHRVGNPENICKSGWGSEVWSCGWDWDQIRNPNINNKEIIWLCNYHISL